MRHIYLRSFPVLLAISPFCAHAQMMVDHSVTAQQMVEDIFQGINVTIGEVTINGLPGDSALAYSGAYAYEGPYPFPVEGVTMLTGDTFSYMGSGLSDPDLQVLSGHPIYDAMVLEFDFVPDEDTLVFEYVFASLEYLNFTCSPFNDVFGFFLSGPGIAGTFSNDAINIARVPGTEVPVSINTVNSGVPSNSYDGQYCDQADPDWQDNQVYFTSMDSAAVFQYTGMTVVLQAVAAVTPGETHHIKLAIGDASDSFLDSGFFLQAASFRSVPFLMMSTAVDEKAVPAPNAWFNATGDLVLDTQALIRSVTVMDMQGRMISQRTLAGSGAQLITMNDVPPGIYIVRCGGDGQEARIKVVKDR